MSTIASKNSNDIKVASGYTFLGDTKVVSSLKEDRQNRLNEVKNEIEELDLSVSENGVYTINKTDVDGNVQNMEMTKEFCDNYFNNALKLLDAKKEYLNNLLNYDIRDKKDYFTEKYPYLKSNGRKFLPPEEIETMMNSASSNSVYWSMNFDIAEYKRQYNEFLSEVSKDYFKDSMFDDLKGISVNYDEYRTQLENVNNDITFTKTSKYRVDQQIKKEPYVEMSNTDEFKSFLDRANIENIKEKYLQDNIGSSTFGGGGATEYLLKYYDYMTPTQQKMYAYLYSKGGKVEAEKYLIAIEDELNQQKGLAKAQKLIESINKYDVEGEKEYIEMFSSEEYRNYVLSGPNKSFDDIYNELSNERQESLNLNAGNIGGTRDIKKYNLIDAYEYLTDYDKKLYAYLYNTQGVDAAEQYLETVKGRLNPSFSDYMKVTGKGILAGIENWGEGVNAVFETEGMMTDNQYAQMYILQALEDKDLLSNAYEISTSVGNMLPSIAASAIFSFAGAGATLFTVVGEEVSMASLTANVLMGASAMGSSKNEALIGGNDLMSSTVYGFFSGLSETSLGMVLGNIPGLNEGSSLSIMGLFKEGFEEFTQEYVSAGLKASILGETTDLSDLTNDAIKSFIYGVITSGVMNGGQVGMSIIYNGVNYKINNLNDVVKVKESIIGNDTVIDSNQSTLSQNNRIYSDENGFQVTQDDFAGIYKKYAESGFFSKDQINTMINNVNGKGFIGEYAGKYIEKLFNGDYDVYFKTVYSSDVDSIMDEGIRCLGSTTSGFGSFPTDVSEINMENTVYQASGIYDLTSAIKNANGISSGGNPTDGTMIVRVPKGMELKNLLYFNEKSKCYCIMPEYCDSFFKVSSDGIVSDPVFNNINDSINSEIDDILLNSTNIEQEKINIKENNVNEKEESNDLRKVNEKLRIYNSIESFLTNLNEFEIFMSQVRNVKDVSSIGFESVEEYKNWIMDLFIETNFLDKINNNYIYQIALDNTMLIRLIENQKLSSLITKNISDMSQSIVPLFSNLNSQQINEVFNNSDVKNYLKQISIDEFSTIFNSIIDKKASSFLYSDTFLEKISNMNIDDFSIFFKKMNSMYTLSEKYDSPVYVELFKKFKNFFDFEYLKENPEYVKYFDKFSKSFVENEEIDSIISDIRHNISMFDEFVLNKLLHNSMIDLVVGHSKSVGRITSNNIEKNAIYNIKYEMNGKMYEIEFNTCLTDKFNFLDDSSIKKAIIEDKFKLISIEKNELKSNLIITEKNGLSDGLNKVVIKINGQEKEILVKKRWGLFNLNELDIINNDDIVEFISCEGVALTYNTTVSNVNSIYKVYYNTKGETKSFYINPWSSGTLNIDDYFLVNDIVDASEIKIEEVLPESIDKANFDIRSNFKGAESIFNNSKYGGNQSDVSDIMVSYLNNESLNNVLQNKAIILENILLKYFPNISDVEKAKLCAAYANSGCAYMAISNAFCTYINSLENGNVVFFEKIGYNLYELDENGDKIYNTDALALDIFCDRFSKMTPEEIINSNSNGMRFDLYGDVISHFFEQKGIETSTFGKNVIGAGKNDLLADYLNSKNNSFKILTASDFDLEELVSKSNDMSLSADNALANSTINGKIVKDIGGHAMLITDMTDKGDFIVSSWSGKYRFIAESVTEKQKKGIFGSQMKICAVEFNLGGDK